MSATVDLATTQSLSLPCAWVSKVRDNRVMGYAENKTLPFTLGEGQWLITLTSPKTHFPVLNCGSLLVELRPEAAPKEQKVVPFSYAKPRKNGASYSECVAQLKPEYTLCFTSSSLSAADLNLASSTKTLLDAVHHDQTLIFNECRKKFGDEMNNDLWGFSRETMLIFPELLVPGWYGIDPQVHLSRRAANNVKRRLGTKLGTQPNFDDASHVGMLAGSYCLDENVRYTNEQIDNLYPWQAFYFRGDDCDGSSMAAYALFTHEFGEAQSFLVSGLAELGHNGVYVSGAEKETAGHSWVMRYQNAKTFAMCETTDCTPDSSHFHTGAFAWTNNGAYAFCTRTPEGIKLGVNLRADNLRLPLMTHAAAERKKEVHYLCPIKADGMQFDRKNIHALAHQIYDNPEQNDVDLSAYIFPDGRGTVVDYPSAPIKGSNVRRF